MDHVVAFGPNEPRFDLIASSCTYFLSFMQINNIILSTRQNFIAFLVHSTFTVRSQMVNYSGYGSLGLH